MNKKELFKQLQEDIAQNESGCIAFSSSEIGCMSEDAERIYDAILDMSEDEIRNHFGYEIRSN